MFPHWPSSRAFYHVYLLLGVKRFFAVLRFDNCVSLNKSREGISRYAFNALTNQFSAAFCRLVHKGLSTITSIHNLVKWKQTSKQLSMFILLIMHTVQVRFLRSRNSKRVMFMAKSLTKSTIFFFDSTQMYIAIYIYYRTSLRVKTIVQITSVSS